MCASIAVSVPSRFAPRRTRWRVALRLPEARFSAVRSRISWTGRAHLRASSAAITLCFQAICLAPKPPPMWRVTTRTFSFAMPSFCATSSRTAKMPCVDS